MLKKNISSDDIFLYVPKIEKKLKNSTSCLDMNEKLSTNNQSNYSNLGIKGSSTFDYLNDINDKYNFPKIDKSFLTNNLRNKKVLQNIENKSIISHKVINPINKLRLSNSCELYHKLTKTFMNDKNSLKSVNNEDLLFEKDNCINNIDKIKNSNDTFSKFNFNNCYIKKSLSIDKNNNENYKNHVKEMNKYYINFLYNKIFPKFFIEHNIKYNVIDNKLNIYYAENERQFKENLIKRNDYLRIRGKPVKKMCINTIYIADKLKDVKRKIGFLKGITDYSFPCIILQKVKSNNRLYELNHMKKKEYCLPYEEIEKEAKKINLMKAKLLSETLKTKKCNIHQ
jgi:hypothetical protein